MIDGLGGAVFLKSIELFGFKSFADKTKIEFSRGIAALLGPNGCGKSNIVDAIKWVLGEQNIRNLRADKMENIIFNGSETRKPLNVAEVSICFENDGELLPLDVFEISVTRRLFRSGESQYFINNNPVRLKEIRELFFDTGIGKSAYSIMEQGKIDQILSNKPEERRLIFEEAAGITKFRVRSAEAERKLRNTEENMRQLNGILGEVKKNYDTLKVQAERALEFRRLQEKLFENETLLNLVRLRELLDKKEKLLAKRKATTDEREKLKEKIDSINKSMENSINIVNTMESNLISLQKEIYGIELKRNNIESNIQILEERIAENRLKKENLLSRERYLSERLDRNRMKFEEITDKIEVLIRENGELKSNIENFERDINSFSVTIRNNNALIRNKEEENHRLEEKLEELREELRALTDSIVNQLDDGLKNIGYSTEKKVELEQRIDIRIENLKEYLKSESLDPDVLYRYVEEIEGLLISYKRYNLSFLDDFLSTEGIITAKRRVDEEIKNSVGDINMNKELIKEKRAENNALEIKLEDYRATLGELKINRTKILAEIEAFKREKSRLESEERELINQIEENRSELNRIEDLMNGFLQKIEELKREREEIDSKNEALKEQLKSLEEEIRSGNNSLVSREEDLKKEMGKLNKVQARLESIQIEIAQVETEINELYRNYRENHSRDLSEYESRIYEIDKSAKEYRERIRDVKKQIASLGHINLMAPEEFKEIEERYNFLTSQLEDLEKAKANLIDVTKHIKKESAELFYDSYNRIKKNFHLMFRRLFGGGRAELKLTNPLEVLESGIEIFAQPPGKKFESLSLLSGGERSLTAVALLFAMYMVKPSPFCVLDEIDAALDENNVGQFTSLLQEFNSKSQFIIITHNKKTVAVADTLYGVTMEESGVSKLIAMKMKERDEISATL